MRAFRTLIQSYLLLPNFFTNPYGHPLTTVCATDLFSESGAINQGGAANTGANPPCMLNRVLRPIVP